MTLLKSAFQDRELSGRTNLGGSAELRHNVGKAGWGPRRFEASPVVTVAGASPSTPAEEGQMTTAPDLPLPAAPGAPAPVGSVPAQGPAPLRPTLTIVPAQPAGGEEIEFDEALRRAGPRLQRYAVRRLRDEHEAEEVVQEALLRA